MSIYDFTSAGVFVKAVDAAMEKDKQYVHRIRQNAMLAGRNRRNRFAGLVTKVATWAVNKIAGLRDAISLHVRPR